MVKELGRTRMEANVSVRSLFGAKLFAMNTVVSEAGRQPVSWQAHAAMVAEPLKP